MQTFTTKLDKSAWEWTMMIMQPDWITEGFFEQARAVIQKQKSLPGLARLRLETYYEGLSVQVLHIGSYDEEGPTLQRMHNEFIPHNGYEMVGVHHEIYLSDPRKVVPEKLKTVLRQPVRKIAE
jgi:hypothetical protein